MPKTIELYLRKCIPVSGDQCPMLASEVKVLLSELHSDWESLDNKKLRRRIELHQFKRPLDLANEIGLMAEDQWHHPRLTIGWGFLEVEIYTHDIGGLLESDFIFAAKVDHIIDNLFSVDGAK